MNFIGFAFSLTLCAGGLAAPGANADCADVALVLAIDSSGSVSPGDFSLQQSGYAAAFHHPDVLRALRAAGTVDVAVVLWGDSEVTPQVLPWQRIKGAVGAERLGRSIASLQRTVTGNTGIGRGLSTALDLIAAYEACALRRIVNVSGDGKESLTPNARSHIPLAAARARATEMGVTVNALAIETEVPDLARWYETRLITGTGAFVIPITDYAAFADAIARKLAREISPAALAAAHSAKEDLR